MTRLATCLAAGLILPATASAADILYCVDGLSGADQMQAALDASGHTVTTYTDFADCDTAVTAGGWDLVIVAIQNKVQTTTAFNAYVAGGGRAILSDWSRDDTRLALFGNVYAARNETAMEVTSADLAVGLTTTAMTTSAALSTFSNTVTPDASSTTLATYPGGSAITLDATGKLLYNAFTTDSLDAVDGPTLYSNELALMVVEDIDGDGFFDDVDCDDADPLVHPEAAESCNHRDDDCDGAIDEDVKSKFYADSDDDGYGDPGVAADECAAPEGFVSDGTDCDDNDDDVHPGAPEVCNGEDDDCEGTIDEGASDATTWYADSDGDTYGDAAVAVESCDAVEGHVGNADDCDDADAAIHPGGSETANGEDDDCNGKADDGIDTDGDGIEDYDEVANGTDPLDAGDPGSEDTDGEDTDGEDTDGEDTDGEEADPKCGCATTAPGSVAWLGLAVVGLTVRSRRA